MKAYYIEKNGGITVHEGDEGFWYDGDITFMETETPEIPNHAVYFDDNSMLFPGEVRVIVGGVEVPLPAWFAAIEGENIVDPKITPEDLSRLIKIPS